MKKSIIIITVITILPLFVNAQITCDTATIYATVGANAVCIEIDGRARYSFSNNYPNHLDNYNQSFTLTEVEDAFVMCAYPDTADYFTPLYEEVESTGCKDTYMFGVMLNGVRFAPSTEEFFENSDGTDNIEWHVEATAATTTTGVNMGTLNGGHLNAFGYYHYHNIPTDYLVNDLGIDGTSHSPIIGYAADGFPIYYKYVYTDADDTTSAIIALSSGYTMKSGSRPGDGLTAPDGTYDGTYYEDYEYTTTTLDSCNGRYGTTTDYPYGTYYYVLTDNYPFIPRCFKGEDLDNTFRIGPAAACPDSKATTKCPKKTLGCMDPFADNYDVTANVDNGSCTYASLPIELIAFSVKAERGNALLNWTTETELNNAHFEIEYSAGVSSESWKKIGTIEGAGTTNETQQYEFLHLEPITGNNYYRLKQIDFDGSYAYSNIINLTISSSSPNNLKVYPNPSAGLIQIETNTATIISVKNIYGQTILERDINGTQNLNLSHLAGGIYFISDGYETKKILIKK